MNPEAAHTPVSNPPAARKQLAWCAGGILLAVLLAYGPTLSSDFIRFDDPQYVTENMVVRSPSWAGLARFFVEVRKPSTVAGYYQPLTMASYMVDALMTGHGLVDPRICHLHNILLHGVTSMLVLLLLHRIAGGVAIPCILALLFALHPVQVESVAWISQRKTVLATPLGLGCLLCYLEFVQRGRRAWFWWALGLYVAANLAKPTIVLLPLVLPLLDAWPLKRQVIKSLPEKWPFAVVMMIMGYVAFTSQASSVATVGVPNFGSSAVVWKWIALLSYNVVLYAGNLVWPLYLSPFREVPKSLGIGNPAILMSIAGCIGIAIAWACSWRWSKPLFVGLTAFGIMLSLALGPVRFFDSCVADRFLYFPMVFLLIPAATGIVALERRSQKGVHLLRYAAAALLVPALILMRGQQAVWKDGKTFWLHVVDAVPDYGIGHLMLGVMYLDEGATDSAMVEARRAVELRALDPQAHALMGRVLMARRETAEAVVRLRKAVQQPLVPDAGDALVALGEALAASGDGEGAMEACRKAVDLKVEASPAYQRVGTAAMRVGRRFDLAAAMYREALKANRQNLLARWNLGVCIEAMGDRRGALAEYEETLAEYGRSSPVAPPEEMVRKVMLMKFEASTQPAASRPTGK